MLVEPGQTLLHFQIGDKIGEGGMGAVWRATDTTLGRDVAIKVAPPLFADDADRLARFEREARTLASLNHPHVAAVYGLHETSTDEGPVRFLSMELVQGEDLACRLARGPLLIEQVVDLVRGVRTRLVKPA
jgi:serine/threonine-protein kinase